MSASVLPDIGLHGHLKTMFPNLLNVPSRREISGLEIIQGAVRASHAIIERNRYFAVPVGRTYFAW